MGATILDGKRIAGELLDELRVRVRLRKAQGKPVPGLAVVLVGNDPASAVYVRNKRRACKHVGFRSSDYRPAGDATAGRADRADRQVERTTRRSTASWCSCRCRRISTRRS